MKYVKTSSALLALAAAFSMHTASAVGTTSMVQRCHGSPAADWVALKPCPAGTTMDVATIPQGYGQSGTMQTYQNETNHSADTMHEGQQPVKTLPMDSH
jgi:hypothetical protein